MGNIFCLIGKSASGKDTLYKMLLEDVSLELRRIVLYTTRPIRSGEVDGREYHFVSKEDYDKMNERGAIIESRCYHTVYGDWYYFTADDGNIAPKEADYLVIETPDSYERLRNYFGKDYVVPLYISLDDGVRLERALQRERSQSKPGYEEMCRRFLADAKDFSEEKLHALDINNRFENDNLSQCFNRLREYIWTLK